MERFAKATLLRTLIAWLLCQELSLLGFFFKFIHLFIHSFVRSFSKALSSTCDMSDTVLSIKTHCAKQKNNPSPNGGLSEELDDKMYMFTVY